MKNLSVGQRKTASMITGNISVGWFVTGVVNQIFAPITSFVDFVVRVIVSLVWTILFALIALEIVKKVKT